MRIIPVLLSALILAVFVPLAPVVPIASVFADTYRLSMLPRYSPEEINRRIMPLAGYLSQKTGHSIEVIIARDFSQYEKQLKNGSIDIGYENPYIYTLVSDSHEAVAMAVKGKDRDKFRGIIIARTETGLSTLNDMRGKRISIVGYTSAGGYLSQKLSLMGAGIDVRTEMNIIEAVNNKQENVIFAVYTGEVDAGFIRESALHRADTYIATSQIKVVSECAWLPNWAFSVRRTLPEKFKNQIQTALLDLKSDNKVLKSLKIDSFRSASDGAYDTVRQAAELK